MSDKDLQLFKKYITRDWDIQGFGATPLFLSIAAVSGMSMKKYLGFGYTHFLFNYQPGYGEMAYDPQDLKRIWRLVKNKIKLDSKYLLKTRALYYKNLQKHQKLFIKLKIDKLAHLTDTELLYFFRRLLSAQADVVGIAHVLEAISTEIEGEFKAQLRQELPAVGPAEFNRVFTNLITPSKISFVNQEERELLAIKGGIKNTKALHKHAEKYFWIENSYAGAKTLTAEDFRTKLINLKKGQKNKELRPILIKHRFSSQLRGMRNIIDFCAVWQDERKVLIFQNISLLDAVVMEIARRLKYSAEDLYYLSLSEASRLKIFSDFRSLLPELKVRKNGCLLLMREGKSDKVLSGFDYKRLMSGRISLLRRGLSVIQELHGTVANIGTAFGRVKIIKKVADMKNFQVGDILVASMTRPEFMPAIKKAAAMVTDEGGITCHAAIIAREMNIPTIIGTKIATQVLRDGLEVEVRANHGVVRILE